MMSLSHCEESGKVLYQSDQFTLKADGVVQDDNEVKVISNTKLTSTYQSKKSDNFSRRIQFKLSINEKDNEFQAGKDHWLVIGDENESPIITFGQRDEAIPDEPVDKLPANFEYTFRVDLSPVFKQFEEKGFYEAFDGSRIAKADLKNVYIAGGSDPLTWDFSNLEENGLDLQDPDGDGIYELKVVFNPVDPADKEMKTWELSTDISSKPTYQSEQPIVDALFNMSLEEAIMNIEPDSTLRTGAKWGGVWTRDVSYSILLAFAYHEPEVAKISLMKKVTPRKRIIQDTGSGGAYPVSSDRTTWSLAAWEIYKVTQDKVWLRDAYDILRNTLEDDYKVLSAETGLYRGESSFLDWREQTYPKWMDNRDIYVSQNLGTNVVHYQAHVILSKMAKLLGEESTVYEQRAASLKSAINDQLWLEEEGYYAQFLYGRNALMLSPRFEALGEALAILFDVADEERASRIVSESPLTPFGTTCIYPQIPGIPPYHNNGIWPFVQSYWNLAVAKVGNEEALLHGLAAIYRAGGLFLTNYENFVAENGDYMGTEINSHRMLWSMAGNLAMVHRVFIGMDFRESGIAFHPVIPKAYGGERTLSNFQYGESKLKIKVDGYGNLIKRFLVDGVEMEEPFFSAEMTGDHEILIEMSNNEMSSKGANLTANRTSPMNPMVSLKDNSLTWEMVDGADSYNVYMDGELIENVQKGEWEITNDFGEFAVSAVHANGLESFISEPILFGAKERAQYLEMEDQLPKSDRSYSNFSGDGFVATTMTENKDLTVVVEVDEPGIYLMDLRYSNGTGPWNTDNNCAMRTLYVNDQEIGTYVMPQRGTDEWSDWGWTNSYRVTLNKGTNQVKLNLEDWNTNMDGVINDAMLDQLRLIKIE
ncbi:glycogen debranching protein [Marinoscillum sp. MHG1-6]|uniref:alpha-L-rhamnosidase-related protein n=1 Tax=Marinoscillum sp. MHG1-6 TaxID=2959627 RepID=UPI002156FF47|nr:glycogen debranching protein [Marinoscillum sp. MHG1-6]